MIIAVTIKHKLAAIFTSVLLVMALLPAGLPQPALADQLSDAKQALDAASEQLNALTQEYDRLQTQAAELDGQIQEAAAAASKAQQAMIEGQDALGDAIVQTYKDDGSLSVVNVLLSSVDIGDFLKNMEYLSSIQQAQAQQVAQQKQLRDEFNQRVDELDQRMDEQDQLLAQAQEKREEAQRVVEEASSKVANIEAEQERMRQLQAQAEAMAEQEAAKQAAAAEKARQEQEVNQVSPDWDTNRDDSNSGGSSTPADPAPSNPGESSEPSSGVGSPSQNGWNSGVASAYGGSSDPSTPNPGRTATGAICNDSSMGVAVPMAWPNYRSYFGRAVEIRYNGRTVIATVNDCGGMGGGSRSLDLQPGVFKAFGFSTCQAWGLRTVQYRFL